MTDKEILKILFEDAGVQRSTLLAENVCTIEKYLQIRDEDLKSILWVDKEGNYIQMMTKKKIDNILDKRDLFIAKVEEYEKRQRIESVAIQLRDKPIIRDLLKYFVSTQEAASIARSVETIENLKANCTSSRQGLINLSQQDEDIYQLLVQQEEWDASLLEKIINQVEVLIKMLLLLGKISNQELLISSS